MFEKEWNHRNFTWFCEIGFVDVTFFGGALPGVYCVPAQCLHWPNSDVYIIVEYRCVVCRCVCIPYTEVRCTCTCTKRPKKYLYDMYQDIFFQNILYNFKLSFFCNFWSFWVLGVHVYMYVPHIHVCIY